jgi:hypothetical protein
MGTTAALPGSLERDLITAAPPRLSELEGIVTEVGRAPWLWGHAVTFDLDRPGHRVLYRTGALEITLFGWTAGQGTRFHDHGGASGAAFVCGGTLIEDVVDAAGGLVVGRRTHTRRAGSAFSFGPDYLHRVRTEPERGVAISIHVYTPAAGEATDYDVRSDGTIGVLEPETAASARR